jgi:hypothetical protein
MRGAGYDRRPRYRPATALRRRKDDVVALFCGRHPDRGDEQQTKSPASARLWKVTVKAAGFSALYFLDDISLDDVRDR